MSWDNVAILLLALLFVTPPAQLSLAAARRRSARVRCERLRGTRLLPLVLGSDLIATYGIPIARFETLPLPGELAGAIAAVPADVPIDLLLDLPAGIPFEMPAVAAALAARTAPTTLIVPRRGLSGGAVLARAAGSVLMAPEATVADAEGRTLTAAGLRAEGVGVEENVPACVAEYLRRFGEPRRPHPTLPFYLALPRSACEDGPTQGLADPSPHDGIGPDS